MLDLTKQIILNPQEYMDFNQIEEDWNNEETPIVCEEVMNFYRLVVKNMSLFTEDSEEVTLRNFFAYWHQCNDDDLNLPSAFGGDIKSGEELWAISYTVTCLKMGLGFVKLSLNDILCPYDNLGQGRNDIEDIFY